MTRRCSHCGNSNHNSRTCGRGGVKLFGVMLTDGSIMKKSASMGNLSAMRCHSSSSAAVSPNSESPLSDHIRDPTPDGYLSDDPTHGSRLTSMRGDRKKGVPWTEEEHLQFLTGLDRLGRGNWSGISRDYVVSRSPSQVASHAQKYFIRLNNSARKKRRSSLFDMVPADDRVRTTTVPEQQLSLASPENKGLNNTNAEVSLDLSLNMESEPMRHDNLETAKEGEETQLRFIPIVPGFFPAYVPVSYPFWPNVVTFKEEREAIGAPQHQVLKPIPVHGKEAVNIDEVVRMSKLSIIENSVQNENILGEPSRQSAFHNQCFGQ